MGFFWIHFIHFVDLYSDVIRSGKGQDVEKYCMAEEASMTYNETEGWASEILSFLSKPYLFVLPPQQKSTILGGTVLTRGQINVDTNNESRFVQEELDASCSCLYF